MGRNLMLIALLALTTAAVANEPPRCTLNTAALGSRCSWLDLALKSDCTLTSNPPIAGRMVAGACVPIGPTVTHQNLPGSYGFSAPKCDDGWIPVLGADGHPWCASGLKKPTDEGRH